MTRTPTYNFISLLIVCFTIIPTEEITAQKSPCPNIFVYDRQNTEPDKWYGTVTLLSNTDLFEVWLALYFDNIPLEVGNWFGDVTAVNSLRYLIKNRKYRLSGNIPLHVRFFVRYDPTKPIPRLVGLTLNAKVICSETAGTFAQQYTNTTAPFHSAAALSTQTRGNAVSDSVGVPGIACGTLASHATPLIIDGQKTRPGEFPWHAALYYSRRNGLNYTCGGSLENSHGTQRYITPDGTRRSQTILDAQNLLVYLGKYYLRGWSNEGVQAHQVYKITRHPQYNHHKYTNDIAVIRLFRHVEFTDFVRPICLWDGPRDIEHLLGEFGSVVGWGYDEHGELSEELTTLSMPVVSKDVCIYSLSDFYLKATTTDTYCAGFVNGTTTCNGDSGGGMVFRKKTENPNQKVYHLRGLISVSVALQNEAKCDTKHYVVFTDVAKYLDFIDQAMIQ
ncbi:Trypsin [Popillia japonica]|uniref:Trypsin n=1 Tax=Popillia japonica TaxID=7064 RepID=A0AAW1MQU4_POPJA